MRAAADGGRGGCGHSLTGGVECGGAQPEVPVVWAKMGVRACMAVVGIAPTTCARAFSVHHVVAQCVGPLHT